MLRTKLFVLLALVAVSCARPDSFDTTLTHTEPLRKQHPPIPASRYGRTLMAAVQGGKTGLHVDADDPHLDVTDFDNLDLDKDEEEDKSVLHKTGDTLDGKKDPQGAPDKPLSMEDLDALAKDANLTGTDVKELDDIESAEAILKSFRKPKKDPDVRPDDIPPPPGMVAKPPKKKDVAAEIDLDKLLQPNDGDDADDPGPPQEPLEIKINATAKLIEENGSLDRRNTALSEKLESTRRQLEVATREGSDAKRQISSLKVQHERAKDAFRHSLESAKKEDQSEKDEMTATIREQKRAFDELFEEKQLLSQMLSDEQKVLKELQEKIQHPDLGLWLRQRAQKASILVETPETDAVKYYAKKYMAPKVTKMRHKLELLEKRVERSVDHLLPAKYGSIVALLLSIGLVGFPVMVTMSTVVSVTKSVSLRQYVLLGNVFLTAFAAGLCIAGALLGQDPLQTLYEASEALFMTLQLTTAVAFPAFLGVIGCTVMKSRDRLDAFVFGCEFVFYALVAMNYRTRVWRPAMLGQNIETSAMMYAIYLMDFLSMTALTISSSRVEGVVVPSESDPESGFGGKTSISGVSGNSTGNDLIGNKVTSLSSGLIHAAMGHGRIGKEE